MPISPMMLGDSEVGTNLKNLNPLGKDHSA